MATLTTLVDGQVALVAPVNANFQALNTEILAAQRTGYSNYASITNIGTGEDVLHSWTMPAGTLTAAGDGYIVRARVVFAETGSTKTLGFYASRSASGVGGTKITLNPTTAAPSNKYAEINIYCLYNGTNTIFGTATLLFGGTGNGVGGSLECVAASIAETHVENATRVVEFTGQATATADIILDLVTIFTFKAAA